MSSPEQELAERTANAAAAVAASAAAAVSAAASAAAVAADKYTLRDELREFSSDMKILTSRMVELEKKLAVYSAVTELLDIRGLERRVSALEKFKYGVVMLSGFLGGLAGFLVKILF